MACPKQRVVYPDTARRIEQPVNAIINRVDPNFAREHRFDVAYRYEKRVFTNDSMLSGAYAALPNGLNNDRGLTYGRQDGPVDVLTVAPVLGEDLTPVFAEDGTQVLADAQPGETYLGAMQDAIDEQFRAANGFCDPRSSWGDITTGTGAGGANPGEVPSFPTILAEDGSVILGEDGKPLSYGEIDGLGVVFKGA